MILSGVQYQCKAGETFDSVALMTYGSESYACDLMTANPQLIPVPMFTGGELLDLPIIEILPSTDGKSIPQTAPWKESDGT